MSEESKRDPDPPITQILEYPYITIYDPALDSVSQPLEPETFQDSVVEYVVSRPGPFKDDSILAATQVNKNEVDRKVYHQNFYKFDRKSRNSRTSSFWRDRDEADLICAQGVQLYTNREVIGPGTILNVVSNR